MSHSLSEDARAVLFPAFDGLTLSDPVRRFLDQGGVSILLGESRAEYVAREMSATRRATETSAMFRAVTDAARQRSGRLLAAVDQELGGICRLHDLVPQFPSRDHMARARPSEIGLLARHVAQQAAGLGVNLFLAPILDVLDGPNPWLEGRTWSGVADQVASLSAAYIRGVQAGGVAATAKHFPGFRSVTGDPATDPRAECLTSREGLDPGLLPFRAAIAAGVEVVMVGPAIVRAIDPQRAALRSAPVVGMLTQDLGFAGVVMADDLDSQATMRGDSVAQVALEALNAGCDFLLLADQGSQIDGVARAIEAAAASGRISAEGLARSAAKVRSLADRYHSAPVPGA